MKTSQVFIRAKNFLSTGSNEKGKTEYICYAIEKTRCSVGDKEKARKIIEELLGDYLTLGSWLAAEKGIWNDRTGVKVQETRHAWLDHLIAHYESIGD